MCAYCGDGERRDGGGVGRAGRRSLGRQRGALRGDVDDAWAFVSTLGITRGLTAQLDEPTKDAALVTLRRALEAHETSDGVRFRGSAWLITARAEKET